jgi:hypothetical protein
MYSKALRTYCVDDKVQILGAVNQCFLTHGGVHHYSNTGDIPARAMVVCSPAGIGADYFREIAQVLGADGAHDVAKLKSVMQRDGIELAL